MSVEDFLHASLGAYMRSPEWLRAVVGRTYAMLPTRLRHGQRYDTFAREAQGHLFRAPWRLIEDRLDATLQVAASIPAYCGADGARAGLLRDRSIPALERLRCLPLVSKSDIKSDPQAFVVPDSVPRRRLEVYTGGSTAEPMRFWLERGVTRPRETAYVDCIGRQLLGAGAGDWSLSLRGRTVDSAAREGGRPWSVEPIKRHLIFSSDHLEPAYMPRYVAALEELRPRLIHAFPSALYPLARWLRAHPCPAFTQRVSGILLTSENAYEYQLDLMQQVFPRARIVVHYGHSERVLMACSARSRRAFTFMPLYGLPELVDAHGRLIERPGELGEIVGTSFDNALMPFVRYRTGDMGMWAAEPVPFNGQARWTMSRIEGRLQEFVVCSDHRLVSVTTLGAAHFEQLHRVDAIQFEQRAPGLLTLKVVADTPLDSEDSRRIAAAVHEKTQGGCRIEVRQVASIERTVRGKHRMLVQHLDLSGYLGDAGHRLLRDSGSSVDAGHGAALRSVAGPAADALREVETQGIAA